MTHLPEGARPAPTREEILEALREVTDPCCRDRGLSIVDLGLVEDIRVGADGVELDLVLTTGWCPFSMHVLGMAEERIKRLSGTDRVDVRIVWDPPWTPDRMSDSARQALSLPLEQLVPRPYGRRADGQQEGGSG